jgi:hypothetical protein
MPSFQVKSEEFLARTQFSLDQSFTHKAILLGTSKGFILKRADQTGFVEYWCKSGGTTQDLVNILQSRIANAVQKFHRIVFYIWAERATLPRNEATVLSI